MSPAKNSSAPHNPAIPASRLQRSGEEILCDKLPFTFSLPWLGVLESDLAGDDYTSSGPLGGDSYLVLLCVFHEPDHCGATHAILSGGGR